MAEKHHTAEGDTPLERYRALRREGELKPDPLQELAMEKLQRLHHRLAQYDPNEGQGWQQFLRLRPKREPAPEGIYLYGDVGRGKSMVMDLFFDTVDMEKKRRVHFHEFMREVHGRINVFRKTPAKEREGDDPLPPIAREIARDAWLLCFDEFEVRDVADAMILGRLFTRLFEHGVVVVATSNRAPRELYLNGLNRQLFLPFIDLVKERMVVHEMAGPTDYRQDRLAGAQTYFTPIDAEARENIKAVWNDLTDGDSAPHTLVVNKREVTIPAFRNGVARASFYDLCAKPLGPADYLAIAEAARVLVLENIPQLSRSNFNEAKRFVTLVDALYEAGTQLICSAAAEPEYLYVEGEGSFEFERTASRLREMQSEGWAES